jgi:hypothetical protein
METSYPRLFIHEIIKTTVNKTILSSCSLIGYSVMFKGISDLQNMRKEYRYIYWFHIGTVIDLKPADNTQYR